MIKFQIKFLLVVFFIAITTSCQEDDLVVKQTPLTNKLVAIAGDDKVVTISTEVLLDGSGSFDGNNKPFTFSWSIKAKPEESAAVIENPLDAKAKFKPDVSGRYFIQLTITQNNWTSMDEMIITATNSGQEEPNEPVALILSEHILTNTTLTDRVSDPTKPDYIVTANIDVRADLTVMPGVVIEFEENKGLQIITGSINANGTQDQRIIFRGKINQPSYWKGILIHTNSNVNSFSFVTIKDGGSQIFTESGVKANIALAGTTFSGAALHLNNTALNESGGYGLYVQGMSALNSFSNNSFSNNTTSAAYIPLGQLHKVDSEVAFTNNGINGIETGGTHSQGSVVWKNLNNGFYFVSSDAKIKNGVTIEPGAIFKVKLATTIYVTENGYLNATGSEMNKITFTSFGNVYWNGILFDTPNQNNKLLYCTIEQGGKNVMQGMAYAANIMVRHGIVHVENSQVKNGLGYGLVATTSDRVNKNIAAVNSFSNLQKGALYPNNLNYPDSPPITGEWLDSWSFANGANNLAQDFYNKATGEWFHGSSNPWNMSAASFGIRFEENGSFTWTIAENSPITGCESYSAEFITGNAAITDERITFNQNYWRSKFVNSCDQSQNVDTEVTPSIISLDYIISKGYNMYTNEVFWELKFINSDQSTFSLYRK